MPKRTSSRTKPPVDVAYCPATTRKGGSCPNPLQVVRLRGKRYRLKTCLMHASPAIKREVGLQDGGAKPGAGRKKAPTMQDELRRLVEADVEKFIRPYLESLEAIKPVVVGTGPMARVVEYADAGARLRAAEAIADRLYGKPKQVNEISGIDGDAIEVAVPQDRQRQLDVAQVLAEVGALGGAVPAQQPVVAIPENASAHAPSNN